MYSTFPEIKAFGCCHEVFGTQKLLCQALEDMLDTDNDQTEIVNAIVANVEGMTGEMARLENSPVIRFFLNPIILSF